MSEPNAPEFQLTDPATDVAERAEAALEGITQGSWKMGTKKSYPGVVMTRYGCLWNPGRPGGINNPADGEFVAAAPDLVRELVEALTDARAELERLRGVAAQAANALHWYMTGIPEQPPSRERIVKLIADLETRP